MDALDVHTAIYDALSDGLAVPVFDAVPVGQAMPYVSIGDSTHAPDDLLKENGETATVTLHIWSDQPGYAQVMTIMNSIDGILHRKSIAITGTSLVSCIRELAETFRDDDARRGILRYRVSTFG